MTLRLRLVAGLFVLVLAGLALFGVSTYSLYARSQYQRLDDQLRGASGFLSERLLESAGRGTEPRGGGPEPGEAGPGGRGPRGRAPRDGAAPPSVATYAELRDQADVVLARVELVT